MNLFPQRLVRVLSVVEYDEVQVPNGGRARYVLDDQGRQWIRKREEDTGWQPLLAEIVGTLLGHELGAPVPEGGVYVGEGGTAWLSRRVEAAGHWSPERRDYIVNLDEVGSMLVLDAIIANGDRHSRNILVVAEPDETHLRVHAIDAGNALVGYPNEFAALGADEPPDVHNHARGLPVEALHPSSLVAAEVARRLDAALLREIVLEGCLLTKEPGVDELTDALVRRCRAAPSLVVNYLERLGALP